MIAVISLIVVATMFVAAARVATLVLVGTGMSSESAAFQARSALMGVGFTTAEAEIAVNHPVRRRVIMWLMTFGNAGIITGVTSMLLGFINAEADQAISRSLILFAGLTLLILLTRSKTLERGFNRLTLSAIAKWTTLETRDFAQLLRFSHNYGIIELAAEEGDWLASRPLSDLKLPAEGVLILGIHRADGHFSGAPTGKTAIRAGDTVIAYGRLDHLQELDDRHRGDTGDHAHLKAVEEQHQLLVEELDVDD